MSLDNPFPLEQVSSRVRNVILREFHGRCPSIREISHIPDKHWLATPGVGSTFLENIRSVADDRRSSPAASSPTKVTDAELLERLEFLQKELQGIYTMIKDRMVEATRIDA